MISLAICKNSNYNPESKTKNLLSKLINNMYIVDEENTSKNKLSLYQTIGNLLSCGYEPNSNLIEISKRLSKIMMTNSTSMSKEQFIGILQVLTICLEGIYAELESFEEFDFMICDFAQWLFSTFLFSLDNPHVYIKEKNIRKYAY